MQRGPAVIASTAQPVEIPVARGALEGDLRLPVGARGLVIFAHGSGSSRFSPRNRHVAEFLDAQGFATLLLDLLTSHEEAIDSHTMEYRFDIPRLGARLTAALDWASRREALCGLRLGLFGASTGAAATLVAAAYRPDLVRAIVSRGGRPDLANDALERVAAPTLLIVGGEDTPVIDMNRDAMQQMKAAHVEIEIVRGATHLFEEPGALDDVERLASHWFARYLAPTR
ncbi:MAG TPA: dienelactone hydrolase family protein [Vicinamibacterales bacterium]